MCPFKISGLGKTTLAHTIARHAGYTVREINASDDRSPESFRLALENGTQMQTTLLDHEKRPNCIVLGIRIVVITFYRELIGPQNLTYAIIFIFTIQF